MNNFKNRPSTTCMRPRRSGYVTSLVLVSLVPITGLLIASMIASNLSERDHVRARIDRIEAISALEFAVQIAPPEAFEARTAWTDPHSNRTWWIESEQVESSTQRVIRCYSHESSLSPLAVMQYSTTASEPSRGSG